MLTVVLAVVAPFDHVNTAVARPDVACKSILVLLHFNIVSSPAFTVGILTS